MNVLTKHGEEIVISGISGRLPCSDDVSQFQDNLFAKKDMIEDLCKRWDFDSEQIPSRGGTINNIDKFDCGSFGIHPRQANSMDPAIRVFLETAIEAIFDSGFNPTELQGTKTGVYVGTCFSDTECSSLRTITETQKMGMTGMMKNFVSHRLSYFLKLQGPCVVADSACSSSFSALELALKDLRRGKYDQALVGGTNLMLLPTYTLQFQKLGVLSLEGKSNIFDEEADGYVRSEAIACIFLQKAKHSRRIYAEVLNIKSNCDGFKNRAITHPSSEIQSVLINEIYKESGIHPNNLSYLECHSTGTRVGDLREIEAVDNALGKARDEALLVGSVKSNMGHPEPVSGLASIIKVIIAFESGLIPPNINLKRVKKSLTGFDEGRLTPVIEATPFVNDEVIVGINNFGFGGTNSHVILKRLVKRSKINDDGIPRLICVSGRSEEAVLKIISDVTKRDFNVEYVRLLQEIFKSDVKGHAFRGFLIISNKNMVNVAPRRVFNNMKRLHLNFNDVKKYHRAMRRSFLKFPIFKESLSKFYDELRIDNFDIGGAVIDILESFGLQIGVCDLIKALKIEVEVITGDTWGNLVDSYYQGLLNIKQIINIVLDFNGDKNNIRKSRFGDMILKNVDNDILKLNIFDFTENDDEVLDEDYPINSFLKMIGNLYLNGFNPQIQRLYPDVEYPVNRGTPMISPIISWDHSKSWPVYRYNNNKTKINTNTTGISYQIEISYSLQDQNFAYIEGNILDGDNIFPITEYLVMIWKTMTKMKDLSINDSGIVFENLQFFSPLIKFPKSDFLNFVVGVQMNGCFEISLKNEVIVKGRAALIANYNKSKDFSERDVELVIGQADIYKELHLRGFNCKRSFQNILKADVDLTTAIVKWEDNWTTFLDSLLQFKILQDNTRNLQVVTSIERCVINPSKFIKSTQSEASIRFYKENNLIETEDVEVFGIKTKFLPRKKQAIEPTFEKHVFVPNYLNTTFEESIQILTEFVFDSCLESTAKFVEFLDENVKALLPKIRNVLEIIPLFSADFTIVTKKKREELGVDLESIRIEDDNFLMVQNNYRLILGSKVLENSSKRVRFLKYLNRNNFLLTREDKDFLPEDIAGLNILTVHSVENEKLILLNKSEESCDYKVVELSSSDFSWLIKLQNALIDINNTNNDKVIVYSQNDLKSGILGFINCLLREKGGERLKCFFIVDEAPEFNIQHPFYKKQLEKNLAINIFKDGQWGTYKQLPLKKFEQVNSEECFLISSFSNLEWVQKYQEVCCSVLNLSSLVNGKHEIVGNSKDQEHLLGVEYSGTKSNGSRVMGILEMEALSTNVDHVHNFIWDVPKNWSLEEAATVPSAYAIATYGLLIKAKLKRGMSILVDSATTLICLAALNICSYYGCEIFVTVGTEAEREFLKEHFPVIKDDRICNNGNTSFEQMIKKHTKARGVDIILHSSAEDKLLTSLRCLSKNGNFVYIGKSVSTPKSGFDLLLLDKEYSFHAVMLDKLFKTTDDVSLKIKNKISKGIKSDYIKPLPKEIFDKSNASDTKSFIYIKDGDVDFIERFSRVSCNSAQSYIIIGGLGGFGLELADWLIKRGARRLVLSSRQGVRNGYQIKRIRIWESLGVSVSIPTTEVTTREGCLELIKGAEDLGRIEGIFNLGVALKDAAFENQTEEDFKIPFAIKADTTKYLDEITRDKSIDLKYFVVFSSGTCGRGNPGQTNYGMANSVMERICENRRRDNLPGLTIEWGAIGDVGVLAESSKNNPEIQIRGTLPQKISSCLECLDQLLTQTESAIVSSMVIAPKKKKSCRTSSAIDAILEILGISDIKSVSSQSTLAELGMDSITSMEIIHILETNYNISTTRKAIKDITLDQLFRADNPDVNVKESTSKKLLTFKFDNVKSDSPFIKMISKTDNSDSDAPLVFIFPGIEGSLESMEPITKNLNCVCLGLKYNFAGFSTSINEMANCFISFIEEMIRGQFIFVCHSFGAILGVEIVYLLESKGYFGKLFVVDSGLEYMFEAIYKTFNCSSVAKFESTLLCNILTVYLSQDVEKSEEVIPIQFRDEVKLMQMKTMEEKVQYAYTLLPENVKQDQSLSTFEGSAKILSKRIRIAHSYKFIGKKIKSKLHLFRASTPIVDSLRNDYNWAEICETNVTIDKIEGDHFSILGDDQLAIVINDAIL